MFIKGIQCNTYDLHSYIIYNLAYSITSDECFVRKERQFVAVFVMFKKYILLVYLFIPSSMFLLSPLSSLGLQKIKFTEISGATDYKVLPEKY